MNRNAATLLEQADTYVRRFDRVDTGGRFDGLSSDGPIRLQSDQELLGSIAELSKLSRLVTAELTKHAGEVARRSTARDDTSLARKMGAGSAANLVSQVAGMLRAQAGTMIASAEAFRPRESMTGEPLPAKYAQIAAAFEDGLLDPEIAAAMRRALDKSAPGLSPWELVELERQTVVRSQEGYAPDDFLGFLKRLPDFAHPDGGAPRADEPAPTPSVRRVVLKNGLVRWISDLDPLSDGFFKTAIDAHTSIRRSLLPTPDEPALDDDTADRRPLAQRRVDALQRLAKNAIKADDGHVGGTAVTLLVTIPLENLTSGLGIAHLPDCGTDIPASVARMLAADAEIIPVVLGGKSQPLDLGMGRRFFSEAQRRAMLIRDGDGCVGPGCDAPSSWCDAAHIRPAGYGPADLDNGILLCWRCHLMLDNQGWQVRRVDQRWWWTPPPWIDPSGRTRPGGRIPQPDLARNDA